jgi:hypothetical protein
MRADAAGALVEGADVAVVGARRAVGIRTQARVTGFVAALRAVAVTSGPTHGSPVWMLQVPPEHVSVPLQKMPSSHGAPLLACVHAPAPSHRSSVHGLLSSKHGVLSGSFGCVHAPTPSQTSSVQSLPSSVQGVAAGSLQLSALSLQRSAHSPPARARVAGRARSTCRPSKCRCQLQNNESVHEAVLFGCRQFAAPSHISSVQTLPSSGASLPVGLERAARRAAVAVGVVVVVAVFAGLEHAVAAAERIHAARVRIAVVELVAVNVQVVGLVGQQACAAQRLRFGAIGKPGVEHWPGKVALTFTPLQADASVSASLITAC